MRDLGDVSRITPLAGSLLRREATPKICRAKVGVVLRYTLLSGEWISLKIHNIDKRDTPCLGDGCPHEWMLHHRSYLVKHYTDAWSWLTKQHVVLEVSAGAMSPFIGEDGKIVPFRRGQAVSIERAEPRPTAAVILRVLPAETPGEQLPAGFNTLLALLANWGADTVNVGSRPTA